jgi:hypothetical protein
MKQIWLFYFDNELAVGISLPGGNHGVLCVEPEHSFRDRNPTLEEMQARLRIIASDDTL